MKLTERVINFYLNSKLPPVPVEMVKTETNKDLASLINWGQNKILESAQVYYLWLWSAACASAISCYNVATGTYNLAILFGVSSLVAAALALVNRLKVHKHAILLAVFMTEMAKRLQEGTVTEAELYEN